MRERANVNYKEPTMEDLEGTAVALPEQSGASKRKPSVAGVTVLTLKERVGNARWVRTTLICTYSTATLQLREQSTTCHTSTCHTPALPTLFTSRDR